jgi:hypothetical protein
MRACAKQACRRNDDFRTERAQVWVNVLRDDCKRYGLRVSAARGCDLVWAAAMRELAKGRQGVIAECQLGRLIFDGASGS